MSIRNCVASSLRVLLWIACLVGPARFSALEASTPQAVHEPKSQLLFKSGREGYLRYRIPALLTTSRGTLLAFCEGRKDGGSLQGNIDIVLKRSEDGGKSWSKLRTIADAGGDTLGNPCPVIDRKTGTIWLALTRSVGSDTEDGIVAGTSRDFTRVLMMSSSDDGRTWSAPRDISATTRQPHGTWYGTGPGIGIQLQSGRLLIPCYHAEAKTKIYRSHAIFSDDQGKTWRVGKPAGEHCTESQAAERGDGAVVLSARSIMGKPTRTIAVSKDGGGTWSAATRDASLYDSSCQASLYVLPGATQKSGETKGWLYSHPAGPEGRRNLTVRWSGDEGRTWSRQLQLHTGDSQYSCLSRTSTGRIGCLYESWTNNNYQIYFTTFNLKQLR